VLDAGEEQRLPVHVFWWRGPNRCERAGLWCPLASYTHGALLDAQVAAIRKWIPNHEVSMVVVMERLMEREQHAAAVGSC
jgi:hypothetical protein